jgi:predicted RNase H-like nuclease (RuvC/YqgF family)
MSKRKQIKELESKVALLTASNKMLREKLEARDKIITDVRKALGENGGSLVVYGGGGGGGGVIFK